MSCLKSPALCWLFVFTSLFAVSTSAYGQVSLTGAPVSFGNVQLGSNLIQPLVVTNTCRASVTIYRVTGFGHRLHVCRAHSPPCSQFTKERDLVCFVSAADGGKRQRQRCGAGLCQLGRQI